MDSHLFANNDVKLSYFSFGFAHATLGQLLLEKAAAFFLLFRMLFGTLTSLWKPSFLKALDLIVLQKFP